MQISSGTVEKDHKGQFWVRSNHRDTPPSGGLLPGQQNRLHPGGLPPVNGSMCCTVSELAGLKKRKLAPTRNT